MPGPQRTQKQIAARYKANLGYYAKNHPWRVARICVSFVAIVGGVIGLIFSTRDPERKFFNPGPISGNHASFGDDCARCHDSALKPEVATTPAGLSQLLGDRFHRGVTFEKIDRKCEACHGNPALHQPNVVANRSCSACHLEHQGPKRMEAVASLNCASCHDNTQSMQVSAEKGTHLQASDFPARTETAKRVVFDLPRPAEGRTKVFASFASGHPEFQFAREKARDPNVLRFNHQRHYAEDIPLLNDNELSCNYCHQPTGDGRYMQRINFAANCQACHSFQIDPQNSALTVPHGDPAAVRLFLRTLPSQYEVLAAKKGITDPNEARKVADTQLAVLRNRAGSDEDLERQVFFSSELARPLPSHNLANTSSFQGCAYCHEVKPSAEGPPVVIKPELIDRWMPHGNFNHAKHTSVSCKECHAAAAESRETSDILVPSKASCVTCHGANEKAGKGRSECITCHTYHATPPSITISQSGATNPFQQMLMTR